ncbi:hypothetical protein MNBD_GAMMA26-16 [hydrothermal vent metagenome]|uniref:Uncharacterized protein n=1 Tax=hydrothermal vent metagenome TaxID=652676 RepID=A0A3B1BJL8_9ZZZZ
MVKKIIKIILSIFRTTTVKKGIFEGVVFIPPRNRRNITVTDIIAVGRTLSSGNLSRFSGKKNELLEAEFSRFYNVKYSLAVNSGTAALHLAVLSLNLKDGDEVIVPSYTFISSVSVLLKCKLKPVFVDVEPLTGNINSNKITEAITEKTKAIMVVHLCGFPCDMDAILSIVNSNKLYLIEDVAQALGGKYNNKLLGTFGNIGCFSFQDAKILPAGEGGLLITNNSAFYNSAYIYANLGRSTHNGLCVKNGNNGKEVFFSYVGYNYRMNEITATLVFSQLNKIHKTLNRRRKNASILLKALSQQPELEVVFTDEASSPSYNAFPVRVKPHSDVNRDWLCAVLHSFGIPVAKPYSSPINEQPIFSKYRQDMGRETNENAKELALNTLIFDIAPYLSEKDIHAIVARVCMVLSRNRWPIVQDDHIASPLIISGDNKFRAGASKVEITPEFFEFKLTTGVLAKGVADPLYTRVTVIDANERLCFVQLDLLGLSHTHAEKLRRYIAKKTGMQLRNIFLMFSHTHSGPDLIGSWGGIEQKSYFQNLFDRVSDAVSAAALQLVPVSAEFSQGELGSLIKNYYDTAQCDSTISAVRFVDLNGKIISTILAMAAHSPEKGEFSFNREGSVTAELPGYLCEKCDNAFSGITLFANSLVADSYPQLEGLEGATSTTYQYKQSHICQQYGAKIFNCIKSLSFTNLNIEEGISISNKKFWIECKNKIFLSNYIIPGYSRELDDQSIKTEVNRITIGELEIITFPVEVFSTLKDEVDALFEKPNRISLTLVNDSLGYVMPADDFAHCKIKACESLGDHAWERVKESVLSL